MTKLKVNRDYHTFSPRDYLNEYYSDVGSENIGIMEFLSDTFSGMQHAKTMLEFGSGPTIYGLIHAARKVDRIDLSDYVRNNLVEVEKWLRCEDDAFNWTPFFRAGLQIELGHAPSRMEMDAREVMVRKAIGTTFQCDVNSDPPIAFRRNTIIQYDVLMSNFCFEAVAKDKADWVRGMCSVLRLLKPGGLMVFGTVKEADGYRVGKETFYELNVKEDEVVMAMLEDGADPQSVCVRTVPSDRENRLYSGLIMTSARKVLNEGV